jgi:hypothetical protein
VSFHVHHADLIDFGEVVVCATNQEHAAEILLHNLMLPVSTTVFEVQRVKGNFYQLKRKEVPKLTERNQRVGEDRDKPAIFDLSVNVSVKARSEALAWLKLADCLKERVGVAKPIINSSILSLDMQANRQEFRPRSPAIEKQSIYSKPRFFSGGSARGR